jgi:hypothetical protein
MSDKNEKQIFLYGLYRVQQMLKNKRVTGILAFALAVFLLAGLLFVSCHHHDDAGEHDDCSICAAAHQITSANYCWFYLGLFIAVLSSILPEKRVLISRAFFPGISGRSPPV